MKKLQYSKRIFTITMVSAFVLISLLNCSKDTKNQPNKGYTQTDIIDRIANYDGNGTIKIGINIDPYSSKEEIIYLEAGIVENGKLILSLPSTVSVNYLDTFSEYDLSGVNISPSDVKVLFEVSFYLFEGEEIIGTLVHYTGSESSSKSTTEAISYVYFSESASISGSGTGYIGHTYSYDFQIKAKAGWNKVHIIKTFEYGTDGIISEAYSCKTDLSNAPSDVEWLLDMFL